MIFYIYIATKEHKQVQTNRFIEQCIQLKQKYNQGHIVGLFNLKEDKETDISSWTIIEEMSNKRK